MLMINGINGRNFLVVLFNVLTVFIVEIQCNSVRRITSELKQFKLQIDGYSPVENDDYVAVSFKAQPGYVVKFEPFASAERVHHMLLYGCTQPASSNKFWRGSQTCASGTHILYAWARNAHTLELPKNVAFAIGNPSDTVQYLVLQIHYAQPFKGNVRDFSGLTLYLSSVRPGYLADVFLFVSGQPIPPHHSAFLNNVSCTYNSDVELHPFAFRTHTHAMGRIVSGYVKHLSNKKWEIIGKRNPLWPQLFEMIETKDLVIKRGDFMAAMCRFDSSDKDRWISMGAMGVDEMCNFYMMYYRDANDPDPFPYGAMCGYNENPELVSNEYPLDGSILLPSHPELEHGGHQAQKQFGVVEKGKFNEIDGITMGQISGLAFDNKDRLVIFHRANIAWSYDTFTSDNVLSDKTPIAAPTVLVVESNEASSGIKIVAKYGKNLFYMPHSVFVDESNYYYTTDVGSHQVIKWEISNGELRPIWKLGELFVPGNDREHFCKPAGVAVSRVDGSIYIADGYCNSRIVKFTNDGRFLAEWGQPSYTSGMGREFSGGNLALGHFSLPHDITLDEGRQRVYVADRENGRIQAFSEQGLPLFEVRNPNIFQTVYSAHYCDGHGIFFIPGASTYENYEINAYVVPHNATHIEYGFRPTSEKFKKPHIIRARGNTIWVGEIDNTGTLWRMEVEKEINFNHQRQIIQNEMKSLHSTYNNNNSNNNNNNKSSHTIVVENFWTSILMALVLISTFYGCCYCWFCRAKSTNCCERLCRCCLNKKKSAQDVIDRKGFQPLKNLDDDDDASNDSDEDDFLTAAPSLLKN